MRLKAEAVFELWADDEQPQIAIVSEYRREYKAISEILDEHPEILEMAHQDLEVLSKATTKRGRKAEFTSVEFRGQHTQLTTPPNGQAPCPS